MDFVFGCWSHRRASVDCRDVTEKMAALFAKQGVPHLRLFPFAPNFAAGLASFRTAAERLHRGVLETDELIAVGDVTLYERPEPETQGPVVDAGRAGDLLALARARHSETRLAGLNGDFAAVIYDKGPQTLTMIRDHCGIVPLFYASQGNACAFSSLARPLLAVPWATGELDEIALATYLVMMAAGRERTFYTSIKTMLPASRLSMGDRAHPESRRYWLPRPASGLERLKAREVYQAVRHELVRSVLARMEVDAKVGFQLSGGLDSSTVAAIACATYPDRQFDAVSAALPQDSPCATADERDYCEEMRRQYPNLRITYETAGGAGMLSAIPHWHTWGASPVCDVYHYVDRRISTAASALGISLLLSGEGGDYCISMKARSQHLVECVYRLRIGPFLRELARIARADGVGRMSVLRHRLLPILAPAWVWRPLRRLRHGSWSRPYALAPSMARNPDLESHLRECGVLARPAATIQDAERAMIAQLDNLNPGGERIAKCDIPVDMRFPLFDRLLIETCMGVAGEHKVSGELDRMLIREAAQPYLPARIAQRRDKGWFSPDFEQRLRKEKDGIERALDWAAGDAAFQRLADVARMRSGLPLLDHPPRQRASSPVLFELLPGCYLAQFIRLCRDAA